MRGSLEVVGRVGRGRRDVGVGEVARRPCLRPGPLLLFQRGPRRVYCELFSQWAKGGLHRGTWGSLVLVSNQSLASYSTGPTCLSTVLGTFFAVEPRSICSLLKA